MLTGRTIVITSQLYKYLVIALYTRNRCHMAMRWGLCREVCRSGSVDLSHCPCSYLTLGRWPACPGGGRICPGNLGCDDQG